MNLLNAFLQGAAFGFGLLVVYGFLAVVRKARKRCPAELDADGFLAFLRARGVLTLADWLPLDADSKAALAAIGDALDADRAVAVGLASQGQEQAMTVYSKVDGGNALEKSMLGAIVARVSKRHERMIKEQASRPPSSVMAGRTL